ncbi:glycosyltransferase [Patescibacteria group bacterium]|nr:glycosyltransferase [Patescibacteria group bacterium]MBU0777424.1 glycosyltransferase [Patescibacteria group bacterium]MBU0846060.1 glycosyltransferase [Patescibacteria group bacterium]MBU0923112.1 glycosyltransferase [Patescibacteria group bacterium]MBU1066827.1 glycosyltransferase [Patescibacteria group bacterium]
MKIALVHDYLNEFGGAERVLLALSEIWPKAPIYTAFYKKDSPAWQRFKNRNVKVSWVHQIPFFSKYLHSPLRFLAPLIWNSFDFSKYDVVIGSAGWYITKGFRKGKKTIEICYCHTPPRWLYGYRTSIEWQKYWPVRVYGQIIGHFMRMYDFKAAQRVNFFIANSNNVAERIWKFYRRRAKVIYPPVELPRAVKIKKEDYYLVISRLVGGKGLDLAVKAAVKLGIKLKIAGKPAGYYTEYKTLQKLTKKNIEFLGYVSDEKLAQLYAGAKVFLALAQDEDFGITPVEAMMVGTPVIAFRGGGYLESVIEDKTGIFFDEASTDSLITAIKKFEKSKIKSEDCIKQAKKFSKERFKKEIKLFIKKNA